jgi:molecular chaperone DnaK
MTAVGIDFGTTNCSLAAWTGRAEVLPLGLDRPTEWAFPGFEKLLPSVFAVEEQQRLFGWAAKTARGGNLQAVKRLLAENEHMMLGGRTYSCRHVAALLFAAVRDGARTAGLDVASAVVTVPSGSTGQARFRTKQAAGMAGIKVSALINEPTAAALAYLHYYPDTERLLVFDWGGGTIDVTVLEFSNGIYREKSSHGVAGLGGIELDLALERALSDVVRADEFKGPDLAQFKQEIERTKIRLSAVDPDDEIPFLTPDGREVAVTRRAFEQEARHYVQGTLQPLQRCLDDTGLEGDDFDAVSWLAGAACCRTCGSS